jgi:hypothetical protein
MHAISFTVPKYTPFSNRDNSSVRGDYLCFEVSIERITLPEFDAVNFVEFPDLKSIEPPASIGATFVTCALTRNQG